MGGGSSRHDIDVLTSYPLHRRAVLGRQLPVLAPLLRRQRKGLPRGDLPPCVVCPCVVIQGSVGPEVLPPPIVKTNGVNPAISSSASPTYSSEGQSDLLPTSVTTRLGLQALARACSIHVGTFSKDLRLVLLYVGLCLCTWSVEGVGGSEKWQTYRLAHRVRSVR